MCTLRDVSAGFEWISRASFREAIEFEVRTIKIHICIVFEETEDGYLKLEYCG